MADLQRKARGLVLVLLNIMEVTIKHLREEEAFSRLPEEVQNDIVVEFLIFFLHQYNRTLFAWLGESKRNELMDSVLVELFVWLAERNHEELSKGYEHLTVDTFGEYLEHLAVAKLRNLPDLYNEREREYAKYAEAPENGKGLAGTLLWEFGKRIAKAMGRENDIFIIMEASLLGTGWTHFSDVMKQVLFQDESRGGSSSQL